MTATGGNISTSAEYRRRARRLRHLHAGDPKRLHYSLRQLADSYDRSSTLKEKPCPVARTPRPCERPWHARDARARVDPSIDTRSAAAAARQQFAGAVAAALDGQRPVLRYSQRLALLRLAHALAIPRFEANLIIAMVQYRHRGTAFQAVPVRPANQHILDFNGEKPTGAIRATGRVPRMQTLLFYASTIAAIQGLITLAILRLIAI